MFSAEAASAVGGGPGTTAVDFLKLSLGARPAALGGAFVGLADDVNAIAYNPAGLALLRRQELTMMDHEVFTGVHHEFIAYAYPKDDFGTLGASANVLYVEPFAGFDQNDQPIGKTSAMDESFHLDYARRFGNFLSLGVGAQYIRSRLDTVSASAYAFDAGAHYRVFDELSAGVSLLNAGTQVRHISESFSLPRTVKVGLSFKPLGKRVPGQDLTFVTDVSLPNDRDVVFSGGAEYIIYNALALRVGGRSNKDAGPVSSLGMGVYLFHDDPHHVEIDFDYAFDNMGEFGLAHRASLTLKFGRKTASVKSRSMFEKGVPREEPKAKEAPRPKAPETKQAPKQDERGFIKPLIEFVNP